MTFLGDANCQITPCIGSLLYMVLLAFQDNRGPEFRGDPRGFDRGRGHPGTNSS